MSCLAPAQIARILALGLDEPHLRACLACRRRLEADRATRDALRVLTVPALGAARREALGAEILAHAEHLPRRRRRGRLFAAASGALAMAAAVSLAAWWPSTPASLAAAPAIASVEPLAIETANVRPEDSPPPRSEVAIAAPLIAATHGTTFRHATGADRDVVTLVDGALELDTRRARRVDVRVGDSVVRVENAAVKIEARTRSIISVRVIVGAARIDSPDERVTLQRDSEWIPAPSAPSASSAAKARSLAAFRDAWIALRAGENVDAMALFDSVTDDVAREEASYWAVIAARRANDPSLATRIAAFLRAFPQSEYADELRAAQ